MRRRREIEVKPDTPEVLANKALAFNELCQIISDNFPLKSRHYSAAEILREVLPAYVVREKFDEMPKLAEPPTLDSALWMAIQVLKQYSYSEDAREALRLIEAKIETDRRLVIDLEKRTISVSFCKEDA